MLCSLFILCIFPFRVREVSYLTVKLASVASGGSKLFQLPPNAGIAAFNAVPLPPLPEEGNASQLLANPAPLPKQTPGNYRQVAELL